MRARARMRGLGPAFAEQPPTLGWGVARYVRGH